MPNEFGLLDYVPRQQFALPMEYIANGVKTLQKAHYDAIEQQSQINTALSNLELNEAENGWLDKYKEDINSAIDGSAQDGHYATALTRAKQLAGKVASDPALIGRMRYQNDYKKFQEQVKGSNDYDQDTKEYALEQNKYGYADQTDANGKVVGGNTFSAAFTPTKTIPIQAAMKEALAIVAKDAGGSEQLFFGSESGNGFTQNYEGSNGIAYIKKGVAFERVTKEKLQAALQSVIANTPGMQASIDQEYKVGTWKTLKEDAANGDAPVVNDLTDKAGRILSQDEWFQKRLDPFYKSATYNNVIYKTSAEAGLSATIARKSMSGDSAGNPQLYTEPLSVKGGPITIPGESASSIIDRRTNSAAIINGLSQRYKINLPAETSLKDKFDAVKNAINGSNASEGVKARDLEILRNNYIENLMTSKVVGEYMKDAPTNTKYAIDVQSAIASGTDLSELRGNPYADKLIKSFNDVYGALAGQGSVAKDAGILFKSADGYKAVLKELGISNTEDAKKMGYIIDNQNRRIAASKENAMNLYKIATAFDKAAKDTRANGGSPRIFASDFVRGYNGIGGIDYVKIGLTNDDTAGGIWRFGNYKGASGSNAVQSIAGASVYNQVNKLANDYLSAKAQPITGTPVLFSFEDLAVNAINTQGMDEGARSAVVKSVYDEQKKHVYNVLKAADASQYPMYYSGDDQRDMVAVTDASERAVKYNTMVNMLNNNDDNVNVNFRIDPDGNASTQIRYAYTKVGGTNTPNWAKWNVISIPGLIESETSKIFSANPTIKAKSDILKAEASTVKLVPVLLSEIVPELPDMYIHASGYGEYAVKRGDPNGGNSTPITKDEAIYLKAASNMFSNALSRNMNVNNPNDIAQARDIVTNLVSSMYQLPKTTTYANFTAEQKALAETLGSHIFEK